LAKHVWQWYWDYDHLGNKYKAIYFGPRLDWMKLFKERKKEMKLLILTGLVIIIVLLALIALMVYAIGDKIFKK